MNSILARMWKPSSRIWWQLLATSRTREEGKCWNFLARVLPACWEWWTSSSCTRWTMLRQSWAARSPWAGSTPASLRVCATTFWIPSTQVGNKKISEIRTLDGRSSGMVSDIGEETDRKEGKGRRCCLGDRIHSIPCRTADLAPE